MTTFDILSFQAFLQPRGTDPTPITECTKSNKGHCKCGEKTKGFTTYTFMAAGIQRCFTVYHPLSRKSETLPVVITMQCYGRDGLTMPQLTNATSERNLAAAKYGFIRIGLGTPKGDWSFPGILIH